jgi:hypothetical protein
VQVPGFDPFGLASFRLDSSASQLPSTCWMRCDTSGSTSYTFHLFDGFDILRFVALHSLLLPFIRFCHPSASHSPFEPFSLPLNTSSHRLTLIPSCGPLHLSNTFRCSVSVRVPSPLSSGYILWLSFRSFGFDHCPRCRRPRVVGLRPPAASRRWPSASSGFISSALGLLGFTSASPPPPQRISSSLVARSCDLEGAE